MKNDRLTLKWIYRQSKHILLSLLLLTILGVLLSSLGVSLAYMSKQVLDIATKAVEGDFLKSIIDLGILILVQLLLQVVFSTLNVRVSGRLNVSMRKSLFKKLLTKDYSVVSGYHSGELNNRISSDVSIITNAVVGIIPNSLSFVTRIAMSFAYLYYLDSALALICLIGGPIVLSVSQIYRKKMKNLHKLYQESEGKVRSFMQECLQNLLVIKSFGNEEHITEHSTKLQNINYKYGIKRNNISIVANIMFYVAITIWYYFALAWGAYKLSKGLMSVGTYTAILQLVGLMQTPFRSLSSVFPQYYSMIASAERIIEIYDLPGENDINGETDRNEIYDSMEEIVLENVSFSYDKENILDNTCLSIKKGEIIAVSGNSGIGKSTLLKLLLGIISPSSGHVYIKLKNGDKITLDKNTRCLFAYVPQGNLILSGSIRENIAFLSRKPDDEYIKKCAQAAQIWDFIESLPNKLDTVLGEKGLGLSEGQVQRIAIARAIYHNSPVILLDEATSSLDEQTEIAMLNSIKKLKNKTCIIVSHRKAAFEICHNSYAISNGKFDILTFK